MMHCTRDTLARLFNLGFMLEKDGSRHAYSLLPKAHVDRTHKAEQSYSDQLQRGEHMITG